MSEVVTPRPEPTVERREALEQQKRVLLRYRQHHAKQFYIYLFVGLALAGWELWLLANQASAAWRWSVLVASLYVLGMAAWMQALAKGRSPAYGFLSVIGIYALAGVDDRVQRRIDDIDAELTGELPQYLQSDNSSAAVIPFWGFYRSIRDMRAARRGGNTQSFWHLAVQFNLPVSASATLVAAGFVLFFGYARLLHATTDDVAYGKNCLVRLPFGWMDRTTEQAPDSGVDAVVSSRYFPAKVSVLKFPKPDSFRLEAIADSYSRTVQQKLGPAFGRNSPATRVANGRNLVEYVVSGPQAGGGTEIHVITVWETSKFLLATHAWTNQDSYHRCAADIRTIADNVFLLE